MDLLHLVDRLEELVASAQKMPIGSRAIIDRRRLLDIVDQMRVAIPSEVREAQELVARRDELERAAEEEARLTEARAEERAQRLVDEHVIVADARRRAEEIAQQSEARLEQRIVEANADIEVRIQESRRLAKQQMTAADEYAHELLVRLERQLQAFVRSVKSGISQLKPEQEAPPAELQVDATAAEAVARFATAANGGVSGESFGDSAAVAVAASSVAAGDEFGAATLDTAGPDASSPDEAGGLGAAAFGDTGAAGSGAQGLVDQGLADQDVAEPLVPEQGLPEDAPEADLPPAAAGVIDDYSLPPLDDKGPDDGGKTEDVGS